MARMKRNGRLIVVRITEDDHQFLISECKRTYQDMTVVAGRMIGRECMRKEFVMDDGGNGLDDLDLDGQSAKKLYHALHDGIGLTDKGWDWLNRYEKSRGRPITQRFNPLSTTKN